MSKFELPLILALTLLGGLWPTGRAQAEDTACTALFEQAAAQLAAEQYPRMLRIASDRMQLCPAPESALLLGLAQANMVDSLAVTGDCKLEHVQVIDAGKAGKAALTVDRPVDVTSSSFSKSAGYGILKRASDMTAYESQNSFDAVALGDVGTY